MKNSKTRFFTLRKLALIILLIGFYVNILLVALNTLNETIFGIVNTNDKSISKVLDLNRIITRSIQPVRFTYLKKMYTERKLSGFSYGCDNPQDCGTHWYGFDWYQNCFKWEECDNCTCCDEKASKLNYSSSFLDMWFSIGLFGWLFIYSFIYIYFWKKGFIKYICLVFIIYSIPSLYKAGSGFYGPTFFLGNYAHSLVNPIRSQLLKNYSWRIKDKMQFDIGYCTLDLMTGGPEYCGFITNRKRPDCSKEDAGNEAYKFYVIDTVITLLFLGFILLVAFDTSKNIVKHDFK